MHIKIEPKNSFIWKIVSFSELLENGPLFLKIRSIEMAKIEPATWWAWLKEKQQEGLQKFHDS